MRRPTLEGIVSSIILGLLIAAMVFIFTDAVSASLIVTPEDKIDREYQRIDNRATIKFGAGLKITLYREPCPYYEGRDTACALGDRRIYIPGNVKPSIFLHEKAHVWDMTVNDANSKIVRGGFIKHTGLSSTGWWDRHAIGGGWSVARIAESFADAVSYCANSRHRRWGHATWEAHYGWDPARGVVRRVCLMLSKYMR